MTPGRPRWSGPELVYDRLGRVKSFGQRGQTAALGGPFEPYEDTRPRQVDRGRRFRETGQHFGVDVTGGRRGSAPSASGTRPRAPAVPSRRTRASRWPPVPESAAPESPIWRPWSRAGSCPAADGAAARPRALAGPEDRRNRGSRETTESRRRDGQPKAEDLAGQGHRKTGDDSLQGRARMLDALHREQHQRPASAETLWKELRIGAARSRELAALVRGNRAGE